MIEVLDLASRAVLVVVFMVAGTAKLRDRAGTREAVAAFGVPPPAVGTVAIALPVAEVAAAILLVPSATAAAGAALAVVLLGTFTAAIAVSLARGRRPRCRCFGQLSAAPVTGRTLARNALLLAASGFALAAELAEPAPDPIAALGDTGASGVAVAATAFALLALGAVAALALNLLRAYGLVLRRLDEVESRLAAVLEEEDYEEAVPQVGLAPGTPAPLSGAADLDGRPLVPAEIASAPRRLLILFTSPHCGPCGALMPELARWERIHSERLAFAVAVDGTPAQARAEAKRHGIGRTILDEGAALADAFEAHGTPSAVLVDRDGMVASWVAPGADAIERLVREAAQPGPPEIGESAPAVEVETLDGAPFSLATLRGREAAVVFWNPGCGYCREMHDALRAYESRVNGDGPALVIASVGSREDTRAEGFASSVVLDPGRDLSGAFGANGTPMAVLVAADGAVASRVAAGASAVIELLERGAPAAGSPALAIHQA